MLQTRAHRISALLLALLLVLAPAALAVTAPLDGGLEEDRINWNKLLGYAECGVGIYVSLATGGGGLLWAGLICARVLVEQM